MSFSISVFFAAMKRFSASAVFALSLVIVFAIACVSAQTTTAQTVIAADVRTTNPTPDAEKNGDRGKKFILVYERATDSAPGGAEEIVESRPVGKSFSAIEVSGGGITVEVVCRQEPKIEVIGEPEAVRSVETSIDDGRLEIAMKSGNWKFSKKALVVRVAMQNLEEVEMSGANVMKVSNIQSDVLTVELSGACVFEASGKTRKLMLDVTGASAVNVKDLIAEKVYVEASGACKAVVYAEKYLSASLSGVSKVMYWGEPKEVTKDICGLAKVSQMK